MEKTDIVLTAQREFSELPKGSRQSPARVRSIQPRFYVERFVEHREAYQFLTKTVPQARGEAPKTLLRALLHYRDNVIKPLEELRAQEPAKRVPDALMIAVLDFTPQAKGGAHIEAVSMRLYIDRIVEHREVYKFLQDMQTLHGEGNKTYIKALLHYRDAIFLPLQKIRQGAKR